MVTICQTNMIQYPLRSLQDWSSYAKKELLLIMMLSWLLIGKKNMADRILIDTNVLLGKLQKAKEVIQQPLAGKKYMIHY